MQVFIKNLEERYRKTISEFNKDDWENISIYQKLSEDFIREFQDKVDWDCISKHQKLSEDFKKEFKHRIK